MGHRRGRSGNTHIREAGSNISEVKGPLGLAGINQPNSQENKTCKPRREQMAIYSYHGEGKANEEAVGSKTR